MSRICEKCGNTIPEDTLFCSSCGTQINKDLPQQNVNRAKKNRGVVIVAVILIAVVIIVCGSLVYLYSQSGKDATITIQLTNDSNYTMTMEISLEGNYLGEAVIFPGTTGEISGIVHFDFGQMSKTVRIISTTTTDKITGTVKATYPTYLTVESGQHLTYKL